LFCARGALGVDSASPLPRPAFDQALERAFGQEGSRKRQKLLSHNSVVKEPSKPNRPRRSSRLFCLSFPFQPHLQRRHSLQ
jgi:hypothetical protein